MIEQLGDSEPDVLGDLAQKSGRNVATGMKWNSG